MQQNGNSGRPYVLVAPNGARRGPADHAALPVTLAQIVETARACSLAGADGIHLHIRDKRGAHSLDPGRYRETLEEIRRAAPQLDLQITTEAGGIFDVSAQYDCIAGAGAEWASIAVREIARDPDLAPKIYGLCDHAGIRVQHILYDAEDAILLENWQTKGIVHASQTDRLFVLGRYAAAQESEPVDLEAFPATPGKWMVCAFGRREHECLHLAASRGSDVRVGFENSLTDSQGRQWTDNAASVAALIDLLKGNLE